MKRVLALSIALASCSPSEGPFETRIVSASDLSWVELLRDGRSTGLESVDLWGDSKTSAHGTLTRLAAGLSEPPHTHSRAFRALIVTGAMRYVIDAHPSQPLGPGSYVVIAAGAVHFAQCLPALGCEVYVEQDGPLDVQLCDDPMRHPVVRARN